MKFYKQRSYYELLEIPPTASTEEIWLAYRRATELPAASCAAHYGITAPAQLEDLRKLLLEAMEILSESDLRAEYDRALGLSSTPTAPAGDPDDRPAQLAMAEILAAGPAFFPAQARLAYRARGDGANSPPSLSPQSHSESSHSEETRPALEAASPASPTYMEPMPEHVDAHGHAGQPPAHLTADPLATVSHAASQPARVKTKGIPPDAEFNGELLREIRQSRGLTLQQVCERTRISLRHLENVEADRYDALPTTVYLRGIVMSLARELKLDPLRVARSYLGLVASAKEKQK
jgi:curved DNA-binding protein CbpA